jgi:ketosteroid isomerase-like protein
VIREVGDVAHPNEDLLRRGYEAFAAGDLETVMGVFSDDIIWHVGGLSQLSGDYLGHEAVTAFFGRLIEISGGTFSLELHDILANDVHGTVLVTARGQNDNGTLDEREVHIWHVANGKATEFWAFAEDQARVDAFFG